MGQGINSADEAKNGKSKTTLLRTVDTRGVSRDVLVTLVWPASDARPARQRVIYGRSEAVFDTDSEDPREAVHRWGNFCIAEIRGHGELTAAEQLAAANARADAAERERDVLRDQLAAVTADAVDAEVVVAATADPANDLKVQAAELSAELGLDPAAKAAVCTFAANTTKPTTVDGLTRVVETLKRIQADELILDFSDGLNEYVVLAGSGEQWGEDQ